MIDSSSINATTVFGGAAIFTTIGLLWGHIKYIFARFSNLFIEVHTLSDMQLNQAMLLYFKKYGFKRLPFQPSLYYLCSLYVKPVKRLLDVVYKDDTYTKQKTIYRKGWKFIIMNNSNLIKEGSGGDSRPMSVSFIRGAFNMDQMLIEGVDLFNDSRHRLTNKTNRFYVQKHFGSSAEFSQKAMPDTPAATYAKTEVGGNDQAWKFFIGDKEFLKWKPDELGEEQEGKKALNILAFPKEIEESVQEIIRWKESENWYREKCIPWKRGYLLYGIPGTGKSALVRAIGMLLDVPIHLFDLSGMSNYEFYREWNQTISCAPCIALIEDVDSVFKGRENVASKSSSMKDHLTFDCFLNCISGVEKADGILLFITTNNIQYLDEALGRPRTDTKPNGTNISTRPGRIDQAIELKQLDKSCRQKIAERILIDSKELIAKVVEKGEGDTGAQFQERCSQVALKCYWKGRSNVIQV